VAIAAYEQWLETEDANLGDLLDTAMRDLAAGFANSLTGPAAVLDYWHLVPISERKDDGHPPDASR
jgi:hypothetical protein